MEKNNIIKDFSWDGMAIEHHFQNYYKITLDDVIFLGGYLIDYNPNENMLNKSFSSDYLEKYVYPDAKDLDSKISSNYKLLENGKGPCYKSLQELLEYFAFYVKVDFELNLRKFYDSTIVNKILSFLFEKYVIYKLDSLNSVNHLRGRPDFYFQDTGLICHLIGFKNTRELCIDSRYGNIFKNFVINEVIKILRKYKYNKTLPIGYKWDEQGHKVDLVISKRNHNLLINIIPSDDFYFQMIDNLKYLGDKNDERILVYQGIEAKEYNGIKVMPVKDFLNYCYESFS